LILQKLFEIFVFQKIKNNGTRIKFFFKNDNPLLHFCPQSKKKKKNREIKLKNQRKKIEKEKKKRKEQ